MKTEPTNDDRILRVADLFPSLPICCQCSSVHDQTKVK